MIFIDWAEIGHNLAFGEVRHGLVAGRRADAREIERHLIDEDPSFAARLESFSERWREGGAGAVGGPSGGVPAQIHCDHRGRAGS